MMKGLEGMSDRFLTDLDRIQDRYSRVQSQLSSGLLLQRASDAPERVAEYFRLRSLLDQNEQVSRNLGNVQTEVDSAAAAVNQAINLLERANTLGAQGSGTTAGASRPQLAPEVKQLHEQLVNLSQVSSQGRYIFSGDLDQQILYQSDWMQPTGVQHLAVATNTRLIADGSGSRFSVSKSAQELFDARDSGGSPTRANAFAALHDLAVALENDDQAGVAAVMPRIQASLDYLNQQVTFYGNTQNRLTSAVNDAKQTQLSLTKQLGSVKDADVASAIMEMNLLQVQQQAALASHSNLPKSSLFDYLG